MIQKKKKRKRRKKIKDQNTNPQENFFMKKKIFMLWMPKVLETSEDI